MKRLMTVGVVTVIAVTTGCYWENPESPAPYQNEYQDWPSITSVIPESRYHENRINRLISKMSLEEKIGQMVQPEIRNATAQDVIDYHLGSVLNGGGSWPQNNKYATAGDWLTLADEYWLASMDKSDGNVAIPIIWGTDAVHGHSNVYGATIFPHNIGLGAANDPELIGRIGAATAKQVTVTGIDWTFAPTLAVVQDKRWGRTYEGYSEDGEIVYNYAHAMVDSLQGHFSEENVVATAKHYIGDGGTELGDDQGDTVVSEHDLINIHGQGYFSSLAAGVQTVMASFNSWNGEKLHGHNYLINDVLKGKMNFNGLVVSDWNGIGQIPGCSNDHCAAAINAGVDMIMVPDDWKAFIANTIADVNNGDISMERIDDAVRRILRVKYRAGLFSKPLPSERMDAGDDTQMATDEMRAIAREAVQKSLVLLKNEEQLLPLSKNLNVLVVGKSADSIQNQTGGWTMTWQGTGNANEDFPNADSILAGFTQAVSEQGGTVTFDEAGLIASDSFDVIVAVIGETPYAEGAGDLTKFDTLEFSRRYSADNQLLNAVAVGAPNTPLVTVYVGGRPLWMNKELNLSDAFVSAWLPGTEGAGVADVLFGDVPFSGKLSYSWPSGDCQVPLFKDPTEAPLFDFGYGLTNGEDVSIATLHEETTGHGCDAPDTTGAGTTSEPLGLMMNGLNQGDFVLRIGGPSNWAGTDISSDPGATTALPDGEVTVTTEDGLVQFSAKRSVWAATGQIYTQTSNPDLGVDLSPYANSETSIVFRAKVNAVPTSSVVNLSVHCGWPCIGEINIAQMLTDLPVGQWTEIAVPLQCMLNTGLDITAVNTPFLIYTDGTLDLALEDIHWAPWTAGPTPDCGAITPEEPALVVNQSTDVYIDGIADTNLFNQPSIWAANIITWAEDPSYIALDPLFDVAGNSVVKATYGNVADRKGVVKFNTTTALDFSQIATNGRLDFDLTVTNLGNATGLVGKLICGNDSNCTTGDVPLTVGALSVPTTNSLMFSDYPDFDFAKVTSILEILPNWNDDHNDVEFYIDNLKVVVTP